MPVCVKEQDARGLRFPVVVGGAAINRDFGRRIAFVDGERFFEPGVFYAKDAFEGLDIMDRLTSVRQRASVRRAIRGEANVRATRRAAACPRGRRANRAQAVGSTAMFRPRRFGPRTLSRHRRARAVAVLRSQEPLPAVVGRQRTSRATRGSARREEFEPRLARYQALRRATALSRPKRRVRIFPGSRERRRHHRVRSGRPAREIARFVSRAKPAASICVWPTICASRTTGGASDVIALQVVTVGRDVSQREIDALQAAGDYSESYFLHGFSVQAAEALAETMHHRIRARARLARPRQALQLGLRRMSRPLAARNRLAAARRAAGDRDRADRSVPDRARTVDGGDHHPPPASRVFQRRRGRARRRRLGQVRSWR
jgi:5-methyltetrahydrofolate--homocysteine methyltransferase